MFKRLTLLIALIFAAPLASHAQDFQDYSPSAYADAISTGQPVVVNFYESWCSRCATQRRNLDALLDTNTYGNYIVLEAVFSEHRDLASNLGINARTSLALIVDGEVVATNVGGTSSSRIKSLLDQAN